MIARTPIPLRWSEAAEAQQMCTLALLEREPHSPAAARLVETAGFSPLPLWLLDRLSWIDLQISRDGSWRIGVL